MIDILIPVLARPHRVCSLLASIESATTVPHSVLFLVSPGDDAEIAEIRAAGARHLQVPWAPAHGDSVKLNPCQLTSESPSTPMNGQLNQASKNDSERRSYSAKTINVGAGRLS